MRTRTGSRLPSALLIFLLFLAASGIQGKKPNKTNDSSQPSAVIAGTIFRPPGFALPGAEVQIVPKSEVKSKQMKTISDGRGEFAVRVPAVPMMYTVTVKSSGYQAQQKTVAIEGEQRKDLTFQLEQEAK